MAVIVRVGIYTELQKYHTDVAHYKFHPRPLILVIFGRDVAESTLPTLLTSPFMFASTHYLVWYSILISEKWLFIAVINSDCADVGCIFERLEHLSEDGRSGWYDWRSFTSWSQ